ncbi:phnA protein [Alkalimarinus sediminis]|uniref:PhnA protein n=1 Tax=Alkalimarinus sediminis TaxID=1632866 RepID=A0A9E8HHY8_9ALTE|nr:phnA protein [Alkalimarinus sediminis]UZW74665.1 phnA protein [Alkalimarinus sediminis]
MSKGQEKHQKRLNELLMLGKDLARRAHSKCELCGATGVSLAAYEVPPAPVQPDIDKTLFICSVCTEQIKNPKRMDAHHWHCLSAAVWSTTPAVQVVAVRMLKRLLDREGWAEDLYDQLYLESEVQQWVEESE